MNTEYGASSFLIPQRLTAAVPSSLSGAGRSRIAPMKRFLLTPKSQGKEIPSSVHPDVSVSPCSALPFCQNRFPDPEWSYPALRSALTAISIERSKNFFILSRISSSYVFILVMHEDCRHFIFSSYPCHAAVIILESPDIIDDMRPGPKCCVHCLIMVWIDRYRNRRAR